MSTVLAVDIGGTKIHAGIVTHDGGWSVSHARSVPTGAAGGRSAVLARVTQILDDVRAAGVAEGRSVDLVGVASAGVISSATGEVLSATDLIPGWGGTPLRAHLEEASGLPVTVLGDVHAHGLGEAAAGAAAEFDSALVVAVGTGIGGAYIQGGQVMRGEHDVAGHLGHILHPAALDLTCSCRRTGHIEPLASGPGIVASYVRAGGPQGYGGREVDDAAEAGDSAAVHVVTTAGRALGEVLGSLANAFDPGVIVLSGSVANSGEVWWNAVREGYGHQAMDPVAGVPLVPGSLGGQAPLIGAALAALTAQGHTPASATD
ncbi:MAG: ROK family protein [bacterium]|nr:ROK family protein [bacterium]